MPCPSGLVVKNGSNTRATSASGIPGPSSITSTATPSAQCRARTVTLPGPPVMRLPAPRCVSGSRIPAASGWIHHRHWQVGLHLEPDLDPARHQPFRSSANVASSSGWIAVGRRWRSCFRAKLSRFFTMPGRALRLVPNYGTGSLRADGTSGRSARNSAKPTTEASGLLRSWATPANDWPMADSFSDCISWSSSLCRSV